MSEQLGPYLLGPNSAQESGIYSGDVRELSKMLPDESIDLILTDPPFGVYYKYTHAYNDDPATHREIIEWFVDEATRLIKPGGMWLIYVASTKLRELWPLLPANSRLFIECKEFVQIRNNKNVQYAFDSAVFWQKGSKPLRPSMRDWFLGGSNPAKRTEADTLKWHSCPKPLRTMRHLITYLCPKYGIVLDLFSGSGTTALAAKMTGRRYLAFEIDREIAQRSRERIKHVQAPLPLIEAIQPELAI